MIGLFNIYYSSASSSSSIIDAIRKKYGASDRPEEFKSNTARIPHSRINIHEDTFKIQKLNKYTTSVYSTSSSSSNTSNNHMTFHNTSSQKSNIKTPPHAGIYFHDETNQYQNLNRGITANYSSTSSYSSSSSNNQLTFQSIITPESKYYAHQKPLWKSWSTTDSFKIIDETHLFTDLSSTFSSRSGHSPSIVRDENTTATFLPPSDTEELLKKRKTSVGSVNVPLISDELYYQAITGLQTALDPEQMLPNSCDICGIQNVNLISKKITDRCLDIYSANALYIGTRPVFFSRILCKLFNLYSIRTHAIGEEYILICSTCERHTKREEISPFSILNNVYPEPVPLLMKTWTLAETLAMSKVYPRSIVYKAKEVANNNSHSYLTGHIVSFENSVGNVTQVLPRDKNQLSQNLQVIFSGQVSSGYFNLPKINQLNKEKLINGTTWLIANKKGYEDIILRNMLHDDDEYFIDPVIDTTEETLKQSVPAHVEFTITDEERIIRHQDVR